MATDLQIANAFRLAGFPNGRPTETLPPGYVPTFPNDYISLARLFNDDILSLLETGIPTGNGFNHHLAANILEYLTGTGYTQEGRRLDLNRVNVADTSFDYVSEQDYRLDLNRRIRQLRAAARLLDETGQVSPSLPFNSAEAQLLIQAAITAHSLLPDIHHVPPVIPKVTNEVKREDIVPMSALFDLSISVTWVDTSTGNGQAFISNDNNNPPVAGNDDFIGISVNDSDGNTQQALLETIQAGDWVWAESRETYIIAEIAHADTLSNIRRLWFNGNDTDVKTLAYEQLSNGVGSVRFFRKDTIERLRSALPTGIDNNNDSLNAATKILLENFGFTSIGEIVEWHDEHHTGTNTLTGLTYNTSNSVTDAGDINYSGGLITINPLNDTQKNIIKSRIVAGRKVTIKLSDSVYVTGVCNSGVAEVFGKLNFNLTNSPAWVGTPTNNHAVTIDFQSNIPARSEFNAIAFDGLPSGTTGHVLTKTATGYSWQAASGDGGGGSVNMKAALAATLTHTAASFTDVVSVNITPSTSSKKIVVSLQGGSIEATYGNTNANARVTVRLYRGSTVIRNDYYIVGNNGISFPCLGIDLDSPATTEEVTYKFSVYAQNGGQFRTTQLGNPCVLTVTEVD